MTETQTTIADWAAETFGPSKGPLATLLRANEEMSELLRAVYSEDWTAARLEVADVLIVLCRWSEADGSDLMKAGEDYLSAVAHVPDYFGRSNLDVAICMNGLLADEIADSIAERSWSRLRGVSACAQVLAGKLGFDLWEAIEAKMEVNRARTWARNDDGTGYHVKARAGGPPDRRSGDNRRVDDKRRARLKKR